MGRVGSLPPRYRARHDRTAGPPLRRSGRPARVPPRGQPERGPTPRRAHRTAHPWRGGGHGDACAGRHRRLPAPAAMGRPARPRRRPWDLARHRGRRSAPSRDGSPRHRGVRLPRGMELQRAKPSMPADRHARRCPRWLAAYPEQPEDRWLRWELLLLADDPATAAEVAARIRTERRTTGSSGPMRSIALPGARARYDATSGGRGGRPPETRPPACRRAASRWARIWPPRRPAARRADASRPTWPGQRLARMLVRAMTRSLPPRIADLGRARPGSGTRRSACRCGWCRRARRRSGPRRRARSRSSPACAHPTAYRRRSPAPCRRP